MKYPMYCIRDSKVSFMSPQPANSEQEAIRQFAMMVNNPSGVIGFAPKDFDLFKVGIFDSESGVVESIQPVEFIVNGVSLVGDSYEK